MPVKENYQTKSQTETLYMEEKVIQIIRRLLAENDLDTVAAPIYPSTKLREELGMDSFNLAELTVHIEDAFGIDIFEDGIVDTVGEVFDRLTKIQGRDAG